MPQHFRRWSTTRQVRTRPSIFFLIGDCRCLSLCVPLASKRDLDTRLYLRTFLLGAIVLRKCGQTILHTILEHATHWFSKVKILQGSSIYPRNSLQSGSAATNTPVCSAFHHWAFCHRQICARASQPPSCSQYHHPNRSRSREGDLFRRRLPFSSCLGQF